MMFVSPALATLGVHLLLLPPSSSFTCRSSPPAKSIQSLTRGNVNQRRLFGTFVNPVHLSTNVEHIFSTRSFNKVATAIHLSNEDVESTEKNNRRRKRKKRKVDSSIASVDEPKKTKDVIGELEQEVEEETTQEPPISVRGRSNEFVEVEVRDIRDMVAGRTTPSRSSTMVQDDDEYEYYDEDGEEDENDSLKSLLADAKRLRGDKEEEDSEFNIGESIKSVISTIITIDFFIVFGLLLWFLAGIFSSYALKDDGIQIAFNGIFEAVVQPALGLLMIGSAAGAVMNKDE